MRWTIQSVLAGEFGMVRDDIKFQGGDPAITGMVPSILYLLRGENGKQVVVDTGYRSTDEVTAMGMVAKRAAAYSQILAEADIEAARIEALLLTHTHWDHADNCDAFPNATVYCQQKDWDYAFSKEAEYSQELCATLSNARNRVQLFTGDVEVCQGITARWFGGHTWGSQSFEIDTLEGKALICGDDIMTFRNVEEQIPVGLCIDPQGCERALDFLKAREDIRYLLPSHDYRTLQYNQDKDCCRIRRL